LFQKFVGHEREFEQLLPAPKAPVDARAAHSNAPVYVYLLIYLKIDYRGTGGRILRGAGAYFLHFLYVFYRVVFACWLYRTVLHFQRVWDFCLSYLILTRNVMKLWRFTVFSCALADTAQCIYFQEHGILASQTW
jgi:hypothetical protein